MAPGGARRREAVLAVALLAFAAWLSAAPAPASARTVWLCKPWDRPNPCRGGLDTTFYSTSGEARAESPSNARRPRIDCFYVYPTVSQEMGPNSDREPDEQEVAIAEYQAARFSQRCRVFAPMYRQLTLSSIAAPPPDEEFRAAGRRAYRDVRDAFLDYLRNHNRGRGFVLIGHSQGSYMLTELIRRQIDRAPRVRRRLVSALLLGGNVTVKKGKRAGGSFRNVPTCRRASQTGCVIGFSTYSEPPPDNTRFGRPGSRVAEVFGFPSGPGLEVVCTNPASLRNRRAPLETLLRSEPYPGVLGVFLIQMYGGPPPSAPTPWLQPQDHYTGRCVHSNEAHVLMLRPIAGARKMNGAPDDTWGQHLADVNIGLGDLIDVVRSQTRTHLRARR
jgi:hypothetical protein